MPRSANSDMATKHFTRCSSLSMGRLCHLVLGRRGTGVVAAVIACKSFERPLQSYRTGSSVRAMSTDATTAGGCPPGPTNMVPGEQLLKSYGNIPPPTPGECPLWAEALVPPVLEARRMIYCNRALNMKHIKAVGFDMDYTLAQYRADTFEALAHQATVEKLVTKFKYPEALRSFQFKWDYMMKGLVIDKLRGNMLKVDRHKYVKLAMHGFRQLTSAERSDVYNAADNLSSDRETLFEEPEYAMVDTLFSLAEAHLYMKLVEFKDANPDSLPGQKTYAAVYKDLRTAVDWCHRDGSLKKAVAADPPAFIHADPLLKEVLLTLRASGRKVFLATNSQWDYTNVVMNFLLSNKVGQDKTTDWLSCFDAVVVACAKPAFFSQRSPLFYVNEDTGFLQNTDNGAPIIPIDEQDIAQQPVPSAVSRFKRWGGGSSASSPEAGASVDGASSDSNGTEDEPGRGAAGLASTTGRAAVYQGGYYKDLHGILGVASGAEVLYVGDHIYGDILRSKKSIGWRTMLVVPELEFELQMKAQTQRVYRDTAALRAQRDQVADQVQRLEHLLRRGQIHEEQVGRSLQHLQALYTRQQALKQRHSTMLRNLHEAFHPVWGQLLKTGHQNSRFAHQLERFACLYTSHVSNLAFVSPDKSYAGRMDHMAHED